MNIQKLLQRAQQVMQVIADEARENSAFGERLASAVYGENRGRSGVQKTQPHRRRPGLLDPFEVLRQGEQELQVRLNGLDVEQLKDIIAEHGMDLAKLAMKWKSKERLIAFICETAVSRSQKGEAFMPGPTGANPRVAEADPIAAQKTEAGSPVTPSAPKDKPTQS